MTKAQADLIISIMEYVFSQCSQVGGCSKCKYEDHCKKIYDLIDDILNPDDININEMRDEYRNSNKKQKNKLLNRYMKATNYHRKSLIRILCNDV
jgi:hypothetical protein